MSLAIAPQTALDGRLINGQVATSIDPHKAGFAFHAGVVIEATAERATWGTVDASGGHVFPGIVSAANDPADELAWCRKGVTTALLTHGLSEYLDTPSPSAGVMDVVSAVRLEPESTSVQIQEAMHSGVRVFDVGDRQPAGLTEALTGGNIRIAAGSPYLDDWARATRGGPATLVITGITPETLATVQNVKRTQGNSVMLELSSDVLANGGAPLWTAVVDGTIDICSMPESDSPSVLPLLMKAVAERGLLYTSIAKLTSEMPARAGKVAHRKGTLGYRLDADAVVVDARTPGITRRPEGPGHVNLVLRRGEFLFLQEEIHAKPASGIALSAPTRKGAST